MELFKRERGLPIKVLNVGSSTAHFRRVEQPHIDALLFSRINKPDQVFHLDLKQGDGVDIVGSITDYNLLDQLCGMKFDIVICSNVLEHVTNRTEFVNALAQLVSPGSRLILTVPNEYPYHNDPIDTMYRPTPSELIREFPMMTPLVAEMLEIEGSYYRLLRGDFKMFISLILRVLLPFYRYENWKKICASIYSMHRQFGVTCVALFRH